MMKTLFALTVAFWLVHGENVRANSYPDLSPKIRISQHVPFEQLRHARHIGRRSLNAPVKLTVSLNLRNEVDLRSFIERVYDPKDSLYGKFLSSSDFAAKYDPSPQDFDSVTAYLKDQGLVIGSRVANTIQVSGSTAQIEKAFGVELHEYQVNDKKGHLSVRYAALQNPMVDSKIAAKILGISGLSSLANFVSHERVLDSRSSGIGTGPGGGLSPSDIQTAYSVPSAARASGQTLALMELDGYKASDIVLYAKQFGLASTPLQNILIDGATGAAGDGEIEVALDIELMMALAPGASKILVYEGANSDSGVINLYAKIASDNLAKAVSTSWGSAESGATTAFLNSENAAFMQMAAQGQSMYAAAGDSGAYDDGSSLSVDDPGSQAYVTSAGGTTLALNNDGSYKGESSWGIAGPTKAGSEGGGGGISSIWPLPSWQNGLASSLNGGSQTLRMVPDISANANPNTGYAIAVDGSFTVVGGTSCVSPILAAITALVNGARSGVSLANLGFANPTLYRLYASSQRSLVFNDVSDGSTNLFYSAVSGYDLSTGLGSIAMKNLLTSLISPLLPPAVPDGFIISAHNTVLSLGWNKPQDADTYEIYRRTVASADFTLVASGVTETNYADTGLQNGRTYFYYVVAIDAAGQSQKSTVVSSVPVVGVPQAPTNLSLSRVEVQ